MPHLKVCVLGPLQIQVADRPAISLESEKARALLAYLAVESDRPHRRETLVGLLWPDSPEDLARGNLRQALYQLRQAIRDAEADPPYLLISRDEIHFNAASASDVDVALFRERLTASDRHGHALRESCTPCAELLAEAVAQYRGKFLDQFFLKDSAEFEEWALMHREALHRRGLEALEHLANYHARRGEYEQARSYAQRQLELDPWREEAHRQLMVALAAEGQRSSALAQYETCRRILAEELGVEPSVETKELFGQISRGEFAPAPGARREEAPVAATRQQPLPVQLTTFVGREREMAELAGLLDDPACRLITLVGPGGIGKTRLAVEVAREHATAFRHGAGFVPLVAVGSPQAILPTMAEALGFDFYGPAEPQVQLLAYLRDKQMLLVVDNVEHLLDSAAWWVEVLQKAPRVKLLVTSREALDLQGEWVFDLEGLAVPESEQDVALESYPASALFLQRARRARVGFQLEADERPVVARLCRLVDGIPLALELAASWVRSLSCSEILQELNGSLDILTTSARDLAERHRSLRAVFDQSWRLLTGDEQGILARLSVFRGGFLREAAEQVAGAALPALSVLVTKSLVKRAASGRYGLHDLVRQYAASRLAADGGEHEKAEAQHSGYYLDLLERRDTALRSRKQKTVLDELTAEIDNIRAAWNWGIVRGDIERVHGASATLWYLFQHHNWFAEGEALFREAAETIRARAPRGEADDTVYALLAHAGYFAFSRGKNEEALGLLSASASHMRLSDDGRAASYALWYLGISACGSGQYGEAIEVFREALAKAREAHEPYYEAAAGIFLGVVSHELGDYQEARRYFDDALAVARQLGDTMLLAHSLSYVSLTALALGEHAEAERLLRESLAFAREIGCRSSEGLALDALGQVNRALDRGDEACACFSAAARIFREIDSKWNLARVLCHQGVNCLVLGRAEEGKAALLQSLMIASESGLLAAELDALMGLAQLAVQHPDAVAPKGRSTSALAISIHVLQQPASTQTARQAAAQLQAELRCDLTAEQIAEAEQCMASRRHDQLVHEVLAW